jgi:hypothetical protein
MGAGRSPAEVRDAASCATSQRSERLHKCQARGTVPRALAYLSGAGVLVPAGGDGLAFAGAPWLAAPHGSDSSGRGTCLLLAGEASLAPTCPRRRAGLHRPGRLRRRPRALRSPEMAWSGVAIEAQESGAFGAGAKSSITEGRNHFSRPSSSGRHPSVRSPLASRISARRVASSQRSIGMGVALALAISRERGSRSTPQARRPRRAASTSVVQLPTWDRARSRLAGCSA